MIKLFIKNNQLKILRTCFGYFFKTRSFLCLPARFSNENILKGFGLLALHILFKLTANVCLPPSVPLVKVMNPGMSPVCSHIGTLLGSLVS